MDSKLVQCVARGGWCLICGLARYAAKLQPRKGTATPGTRPAPETSTVKHTGSWPEGAKSDREQNGSALGGRCRSVRGTVAHTTPLPCVVERAGRLPCAAPAARGRPSGSCFRASPRSVARKAGAPHGDGLIGAQRRRCSAVLAASPPAKDRRSRVTCTV